MKPTPEVCIAAAANHVAEVSPRTSAAKALVTIARLADLDIGELAEALVLTGVTKLGPFNFVSLPNDAAVIQAIRSEDPIAREFIKKECRRRPLGHVASVLRCSTTWVRAAQEHWRLELWPTNRQSQIPLPEEERIEETMTPRQIRDLVTKAMDQYRGYTSEAAWSLGVRHRWLMHQLATKGRTPKPPTVAAKAGPLRLSHSGEASAEEKNAIKQRIIALGGVAAWAREAGLHYTTARKQALRGGYHRELLALSSETTLARLRAWIDRTGYDGVTNAVGSSWLAKNVVLVDHGEYDKNRIQKAMRTLGFKAIMRTNCADWVWVRAEKEVDKASEEFQYRDADRAVVGIWDLSTSKRAERARIRSALLSGNLAPTPELLEKAGLQIK